MFSLNAPVPPVVARLAASLAADLPDARARARGEHTLVCKRLGEGEPSRLAARVRECLRGAPAVQARASEVDIFRRPPTGPAPVVYLAVESPGLRRLHRRLCGDFTPVDDIEGDDYVPHVTIARGGSAALARRLSERSLDPVEWTVSELVLFDADRGEPVGTVSLPA